MQDATCAAPECRFIRFKNSGGEWSEFCEFHDEQWQQVVHGENEGCMFCQQEPAKKEFGSQFCSDACMTGFHNS